MPGEAGEGPHALHPAAAHRVGQRLGLGVELDHRGHAGPREHHIAAVLDIAPQQVELGDEARPRVGPDGTHAGGHHHVAGIVQKGLQGAGHRRAMQHIRRAA